MTHKVYFVLAVLAIVAVLETTAGITQCPSNERYQICGPACPLTCANLANPPACLNNYCVRGCFCQPGYYRKGDRTCVAMSAC